VFAVFLIAFPLLGSLYLFVNKNGSFKTSALVISLIELESAINTLFSFNAGNKTTNLNFDIPWVTNLGINFNVGIDGISMILVLLTAIAFPLIILTTYKHTYKNSFYGLMLLMQCGLMGVFMAKDAFLFYVFYEMALIPIYFICAIWGGTNRIRVTLKFFIYTMTGSLFMLIAIIYLYLKTPVPHNFNIQNFYHLTLSATQQSWLFWAFFVAFAIKMPVFPFHTWQPDTYTESPAAGTMLLAGVMLKMGIYGLIRFVIPIFPLAVAHWQWLAITLCIIGIVYASIIAFSQNDLKRLIAYSSIAHVGLMGAGVFSLTIAGLQGAMIQMFNHGIIVIAMFAFIDYIEQQTGTRLIDQLGGIANVAKRFSVLFMIVMLASVGLPLTNSFVGEFLLLFGLYHYSAWVAAFAGLTIILGAVYMFNLYRHVFLGESNEITIKITEPRATESGIYYIIIFFIVLLGILPGLLLNISEPAVQNILNIIGK
jgi:NADH-quinone oxidoreductase subunit M